MKRRNDCGKKRPPKRNNKITENMYGSNTLLYMKFLILWAVVITADFMLEFRFEFLWPFWLLLRSVHDSFKYKGLAFSVLFVCIAITSDLVCLFFIPVNWLFFAASTYVWVQYVWHTDKGICLPTIILWMLFVYFEAAIRWKDNRHIPHLDMCRPFAAHCIGYPVVTLGFGFKSYVGYRIRQRKQREVAKENEFYMQLLLQALPQEESNELVNQQNSQNDLQKEISVSVNSITNQSTTNCNSKNAQTNNNKILNLSGVNSVINGHVNGSLNHNSSNRNRRSLDKEKCELNNHSSINSNLNISSSSCSSSNNKTTTTNHHSSNNQSSANGGNVGIKDTTNNKLSDTREIYSNNNNHCKNDIKINTQTNNSDNHLSFNKNDKISTVENHQSSKHDKSNSETKQHSNITTDYQNSNYSESNSIKMKNFVNYELEVEPQQLTIAPVVLNTSSNLVEVPEKNKNRKNRFKQQQKDNQNTENINNHNHHHHHQHQQTIPQICDSCLRLENEAKKLRTEINHSKHIENDLRQKIDTNGNLKSCLLAKQKDLDDIEKRLQDLSNLRQLDRQSFQNERRLRQSLESQLTNERKQRKQAEEKVLRSECGENCKLKRQQFESELNKIRRDFISAEDGRHLAEQKNRNYEQELRKYENELRNREAQQGTDVLMSALAAMQDKNTTLEKNLSAETRVKLDLFSALGEAKRQLEIRESMVRNKDKEVLDLKAKIAQILAVMPSMPNDSLCCSGPSSGGSSILRLNDTPPLLPHPQQQQQHSIMSSQMCPDGTQLLNQLMGVMTSTSSTNPSVVNSSTSQVTGSICPSMLDPNATAYTPKNSLSEV